MSVSTIWFAWQDYTIFFSMLGGGILIGIYFACKKKKTDDDYLLGGKSMKVFPVAASLIASNISGIILMAVPADVYQYGASFIWSPISMIITVLGFMYIYMPVLLRMEYNTIFEYLEVRFNRTLRLLASAFFILQILLNNPILIFIPTLAFSQVSGFPIHAITIIVCLVCIFYTSIGGLKAVVWTDTLQSASMYLSVMVIFCLGIYSAGGFGNVWHESVKGQRLDVLKFNIDVTDRNNFWAVVTGYSAVSLNNVATHQATIQRLMAVPTYSKAVKVLWVFLFGVIAINTFSTVMGLLVYARYSSCDPVTKHDVGRYDQILPYFVLDIARKTTGLSGLFIAGVFSAALSSLSTNLNTLAGVIYSDFLSPHITETVKNAHQNTILKSTVIITGVICIGSVFVVEKLGGIIPLASRFFAVTGGPLLGLFTLGVTTPKAHSKGAVVGGIAGVAVVSWIVIGNCYYQSLGFLEDVPKPSSVENCTSSTIVPMNITTPTLSGEPFILYKLNFWWYTPLGVVVTVFVGYLSSLLISNDSICLRPELIAPWFQFLLDEKNSNTKGCNDESKVFLNSK